MSIMLINVNPILRGLGMLPVPVRDHGRRQTARDRHRARQRVHRDIRREAADHRRWQRANGLPVCRARDCWCFPWYGNANRTSDDAPIGPRIAAGTFIPDSESPGFGAWLCPSCGSPGREHGDPLGGPSGTITVDSETHAEMMAAADSDTPSPKLAAAFRRYA